MLYITTLFCISYKPQTHDFVFFWRMPDYLYQRLLAIQGDSLPYLSVPPQPNSVGARSGSARPCPLEPPFSPQHFSQGIYLQSQFMDQKKSSNYPLVYGQSPSAAPQQYESPYSSNEQQRQQAQQLPSSYLPQSNYDQSSRYGYVGSPRK